MGSNDAEAAKSLARPEKSQPETRDCSTKTRIAKQAVHPETTQGRTANRRYILDLNSPTAL